MVTAELYAITLDITAPGKVAELVRPILDAMNEAVQKQPMDESSGSPLWRSSELLSHLFKDKSPAADEALVVLFSYYLGESNGEDLIHEVMARGRGMLPYLIKYRHHAVKIPDRQYPALMHLPLKVRDSFFREALSAIEKGSA